MDFLNDKKNQPIIAGVLIAIILLAGGIFYFTQLRPSAPVSAPPTDQTITPPQATPPAGGDTSGQNPTAQAGGGFTGAPAGGQPVASGQGAVNVAKGPGGPKPVLKARPDPFKDLNPPKARKRIVVREAIPYPTTLIVPRKRPVIAEQIAMAQADTTQRRMSGVIFNGTVTAILEIDGNYQIVKPGDVVEGGAMVVDKIEPNKLILRSVAASGTKPRYVEVKMAVSSTASEGGSASVSTPPPPPSSSRGRYDRNRSR
jgi:hypothetical protein